MCSFLFHLPDQRYRCPLLSRLTPCGSTHRHACHCPWATPKPSCGDARQYQDRYRDDATVHRVVSTLAIALHTARAGAARLSVCEERQKQCVFHQTGTLNIVLRGDEAVVTAEKGEARVWCWAAPRQSRSWLPA